MSVAEIRGLTVKYGQFTAVDNFDLTLPNGGIAWPELGRKTIFLKTLGVHHSGGGWGNRTGDGHCHARGRRFASRSIHGAGLPHPRNTAVQFVSLCGVELVGSQSRPAESA
ncbi:MAG: hypothetical protein R2688_01160 [Fimbriimonadaceae bacterium]